MMVQGLLIYYAGFTVLRGMGFETARANQIWSTFTAVVFVTISLNSTAYMMEVLRGGIESIDPGRAEAALVGLSQWQAMARSLWH